MKNTNKLPDDIHMVALINAFRDWNREWEIYDKSNVGIKPKDINSFAAELMEHFTVQPARPAEPNTSWFAEASKECDKKFEEHSFEKVVFTEQHNLSARKQHNLQVSEQLLKEVEKTVEDNGVTFKFSRWDLLEDNTQRFEQVVEHRLQQTKEVMLVKGKEYRRNGNVYHNFDRAAAMLGQTRERALIGMAVKHFVSLLDIVDDLDEGKIPTQAMLDEKCGDAVNYLLLLEGAIKERLK